ncbi:hypothetical protein GCM10022408_11690 [Hymenobacter fastidiosus]|uniref:Uncharacterized protein n=1 Tax=Hymenobacter fastidiosus TaxID=486264 RepID=A0ABP7RTG5_9BACT
MGSIVGIGFGAATVEVDLVRRDPKNLLIAAGISLVVSTLYFRRRSPTRAPSCWPAPGPPPETCSLPC